MGTHPIFESDFDCLTDLKMTDVPRKRYRRADLEKASSSEASDPEEELYVPLKERRKMQFTEIEEATGRSTSRTGDNADLVVVEPVGAGVRANLRIKTKINGPYS